MGPWPGGEATGPKDFECRFPGMYTGVVGMWRIQIQFSPHDISTGSFEPKKIPSN
jgi:hypothetical protein